MEVLEQYRVRHRSCRLEACRCSQGWARPGLLPPAAAQQPWLELLLLGRLPRLSPTALGMLVTFIPTLHKHYR